MDKTITSLDELGQMETEFVSLVSHELRTPLTVIKWFTEMLLAKDSEPLSDTQSSYLNGILQANKRMIKLINMLLNISRVESGRLCLDPSDTHLRNIVQEALNDLKDDITRKKIAVDVQIDENIPSISIDPKLILQVYWSLLSNAVKYTSEAGKVSLHLFLKDSDVVSEITDDGYSIPEGEQDKVFQKFYRAKNIHSMEPTGTGLGLYLTKALVEISGGKIWLESPLQMQPQPCGTRVSFTLPLSGSQRKEGEVSITSYK